MLGERLMCCVDHVDIVVLYNYVHIFVSNVYIKCHCRTMFEMTGPTHL